MKRFIRLFASKFFKSLPHLFIDLMPNLLSHLDIDFDIDMKERTTSSRTEMQLLLSDSPIKVITCKAGNRICKSLVITEAEFGKPEADSAPTFLKND